jgi:hypothetical protein
MPETNFCFCTLALGKEYCDLALLLAEDIALYAPGIPFVILTDRPSYFRNKHHILVFKHSQKSVGCYQDKLYVISQALSLFNSCIFMDADMRILKKFPEFQWLPGITARSCANIAKHFATEVKNVIKSKNDYSVIKKTADTLNLNLAKDDIQFVNEFLFVVTRDKGKEIEFLQLWERLGRYFELNGMYDGEGHTIGLAAAKVGFPIRHDVMENFDFFKDKIEQIRINKGQSDPNQSHLYFEKREEISRNNRTFVKRVIRKITKKALLYYRLMLLKVVTMKGLQF